MILLNYALRVRTSTSSGHFPNIYLKKLFINIKIFVIFVTQTKIFQKSGDYTQNTVLFANCPSG